jgi:radical SAM protein with 4Fe4S-binding SPASM domain
VSRPELYFGTAVSKLNIGDLARIFDLAREMRVNLIQMVNMDPVTPEQQSITLSPEDRKIFEDQKPHLDRTSVPCRSCLYFDGAAEGQNTGSSEQKAPCTPATETPGKNMCGVPWAGLIVRSDGVVNPCFRIWDVFGNLNEQTLEEIWNGPSYKELRRAFATQTGFHGACVDCRDTVKTLLS